MTEEPKSGVVAELAEALLPEDVKLLKNAIRAPPGLFADICDSTTFLVEIKSWDNHDKYLFDSALRGVRPDLVAKARHIRWLSCPGRGDYTPEEDSCSIKSFVYLLKTEPRFQDWQILLLGYDFSIKTFDFPVIIKHCLEGKIINKDLHCLINEFRGVKRIDIADKLKSYVHVFSDMTQSEFENELKEEVHKSTKPPDTKLWGNKLKRYTFKTYSQIKPLVGSTKSVDLKGEFFPLTIVSHSMGDLTGFDDGTERELDMLEKFYKQEKVPGIDFLEKIRDYDTMMEYGVKYNDIKGYTTITVNLENSPDTKKFLSLQPKEGRKMQRMEWKKESWCLIGNPGSGKTFLCSRIALLYGSGELKRFDFSLSIPCRKQEWHRLESDRLERKEVFSEKLIKQWIKLGLPVSDKELTRDLSEHIVKTEGRRLLLIIDSIDEFTKDVPFKETLLYLLLRRKCLKYATIIFTSRPGAWYDTSSQYHNLKITAEYKVLGFSPKNRDLYISSQLTDQKFKQCQKLFYYYNEIRLLCLVPVNASLIVSLFQSSDSVNINSLTQLYSYLTLNLVKRQLSRMGLEELSKKRKEDTNGQMGKSSLFELDDQVLKCLREIGEVAYNGVAHREMVSNGKFFLGKSKIDSECLGLVNVSFKEKEHGKKSKVWSFSHLTMQEFVSSLWLHGTGWLSVCLVTRFVVSSAETFSLFKMVMRFVCGLLADSALPVLYVVFKHILDKPLSYGQMSLCTQFRYENYYNLDYAVFTNQFITISSLLAETNSPFLKIRKLLPKEVSFYIESIPAPNEWLSFINSLRFFKQIHLIQFSTDYINPNDFSSLIDKLGKCNVEYIALEFSLKSYNEIKPYIKIIESYKHCKISVDFNFCSLNDTQLTTGLSLLSTNHSVVSINLFNNIISTPIMHILKNRGLSSLENLYFYPHNPKIDYDALLPQIMSIPGSRLQGLHLYHVPEDRFSILLNNLSSLSQLLEFSCVTRNAYSTLSQLSALTKLNHLYICGISNPPISSRHMLHFLYNNSNLRAFGLKYADSIKLISLNVLFMALHTCTNLVCLKLEIYKNISFVATACSSNLRMPPTLVYFEMIGIQFQDRGLRTLIKTIAFHTALRYLKLCACLLTSNSCLPLCNLISTLRRLKSLKVDKQELSKPDRARFNVLNQFADTFSIELVT